VSAVIAVALAAIFAVTYIYWPKSEPVKDREPKESATSTPDLEDGAEKPPDKSVVVPNLDKGIAIEQKSSSEVKSIDTVNGPSAGDILKERREPVVPVPPSPVDSLHPDSVKNGGNKLGKKSGKKGNNTQQTRDDTPPKATWTIKPGGAYRTD
jgi:hypothetical protein